MKNTYCSNCNIELSHTETVCPLCGTRFKAESAENCGAYPSDVEQVPLTRRHVALKGLIVLLFPALCCFAVDFMEHGFLTWVLYIWGAETCLFTYAFLPKLFARPKLSLCLAADCAVTTGYLFLIGLIDGSTAWVLPLGLPITLLAGFMAYSFIEILRIKKLSQLFKSAALICTAGFYALAVQLVIGVFKHGALVVGWGLPVLLPSLFVSLLLFYIESDSELKDRIRRAVSL